MVGLLALLAFLALLQPASGQEVWQHFQPADRSFLVDVPLNVRSVEQGGERCLWGCDDGRKSFLFGYAVVPRAATMSEGDLRPALGQFLTAFLKNAQVREKSRSDVTVLGRPGVESIGSATYGRQWTRVIAVGARVYILASEGTGDEENKRYWASFKARSNP